MKIRFPEDNKICFFQDMSFWQNVPSDIEFDMEIKKSGTAWLTGPGYGERGNYGNGSIAVRFGSVKGFLDEIKCNIGDLAYNSIQNHIKNELFNTIIKQNKTTPNAG